MHFREGSQWRILLLGFLLAMGLVSSNLLAGTTGKISGRVVDAKTKEPLPGVNVQIENTTMGAATNDQGYYVILNVPPGTYSVKATMIGYNTLRQTQVRVNVDCTTFLNFELQPSVVQGKEVVVTAHRPAVELDVSSSQIVTTASQAAVIPASEILETFKYQPGVQIVNMEELRIRGGGSDQISFEVDGLERMDRLNTKAFTQINSATVSEVQLISGGFNAEYGNVRSGVFNVVTREGGRKFSGSIDYRIAPPQHKHFGPDAYGPDEYIYKLYGSDASFDEVKDVEGNVLWQGWKKRTQQLNAQGYKGKSNWTPEEVQQIWKWHHRPWPYADSPDHFLDAGFGGPLNLKPFGIKEAGYYVGYKFTRYLPPFPIYTHYYQSSVKEAKLNFKPRPSMKIVLNAMLGDVNTSGNGQSWQGNNWSVNLYHGGEDLAGLATGTGEQNRFNLAGQAIIHYVTKQIGAKLTHTLSPSTYYEVRYNRFWVDSKTGRAPARSLRTYGVKEIGGIWFDETPRGWVELPEKDLTGAYALSGGGTVRDTSGVVTNQLNLDLASQINAHHFVKTGFELETNHLNKDYERIYETMMLYGEFVNYDESPFRWAYYIQDKVEYGGMIANVGVRVDHFDANSYVYTPDDPYSRVWGRGGAAGLTLDQIPHVKSKPVTTVSPRFGISHPVREKTKFFFNYGVFYSEPPNSKRFGIYSETKPFGTKDGEPRWRGYPNLDPPRTTMYEVGFEQSFRDDFLLRATVYYKDAEDQIGNLRVQGASGSHMCGETYLYARSGGAPGYNTPRNNNYQDIRGIEIRLQKTRGRFLTGWLNYDYRTSVTGYYGYSAIYQDPLIGYYIPSAVALRSEPEPTSYANVDVHTPPDWGTLKGDWRVSVVETWRKGPRLIWNPEGLPIREVRTIFHWVDYWNTDVRIMKGLHVGQGTRISLYMDIKNLFNNRHLNFSALSKDEKERYITQLIQPFGYKVGSKKTWDAFTQNWTDKQGNPRAPIAPEKDFALFLFPRNFLFGIRLDW